MGAIQRVLDTAASMKGQRDSVIDLYNSFLPHPRGYKAKYSDLACATFCSSVFIALKWTSLVPPECAAWRLYRNMEALGCAMWGGERTPNPGDLIFFGVGDSVSKIDHVGIVEKVQDGTIYFWDIRSTVDRHYYKPGNKSHIKNYGYILAYATPDYLSKDDPEPTPQPTYEFKVGDLVTINPGARWYKGESIKMSCINDKWFVMSVKGDRVVLGMNLAETRNIQSPIHACDITLVAEGEPSGEPVKETVTITATINVESKKLLDIIAEGNHMTYGEIIDNWLKDYI